MPANSLTLFEAGFDFIPDLIAVDFNSDQTGDRINLKNWERAYLVIEKPAGTAGDDISIQLNQATAASSGSTKALTFNKWWYKKGSTNDFTAVPLWTAITEATATADLDLQTPTDYLLDTSAAVIVVEVRADALDGAGGYTYAYFFNDGTDVGNALVANTYWILHGNRYPQALPLTSLS